jgi:YHS domain-containing protein
MFFRTILFLIGAVVVISMLRAVIGALGKMFGDFVNPAQPPPAARRPSVPSGGELKKDPVCGTFISTGTAIQKRVGSEVYYFCSTACRDKFKG